VTLTAHVEIGNEPSLLAGGGRRTPPPCLYYSEAWLAAEHDRADVPPLYVRGSDARGDAGLACYGFTESSNPWPYARPDLLAEQLGFAVPGPLLPGYLLGGRRPGHSEIDLAPDYFSPDCDEPGAVVEVVTHALAEAARRGARCIVAPYVTQPVLAAVLDRLGFLRAASPSRWELDLPGGGFSSYYEGLSRSARSNLNIERRRVAAAGCRGEVVPLTRVDLDELVALELAGYQRFGHVYHRSEAEGLHHATRRHLGDDVVVSQLRDRCGNLLCFAVLVRWGEWFYARQGAVDHTRASGLPVYFETSFYQTIEYAYQIGVRHIDYSVTSDRAKKLRGCREVATSAHLRLIDSSNKGGDHHV
jgi:uncharacterized protein